MPADVAELVAAARDGDRDAFDELVKATYVETYTLAFRLTGDEEDARDVVQESYLRAYRGLKRFRGDAQFSTWMYRITANCASTYLGKRKRKRVLRGAQRPRTRELGNGSGKITETECELPSQHAGFGVVRCRPDHVVQANPCGSQVARFQFNSCRRKLSDGIDALTSR